jgi:tetratricopeptide (TPR) repeat protein
MNWQPRLVFLALAAWLAAGLASNAAEDNPWVGETVLPKKPNNDIKFGDRVGDRQVYFPLASLSLQVRDERDGWLRIHDGHREGWAEKDDFVLGRDAPAYFHRRVQANPKDTWALFMRGAGWLEKKEPDNAIQDFNECIRLDPTDAAAYNYRGRAWSAKKDYDRAIRDYDKALRLDPKDSAAFNNRGNTWSDKKDYDRAIRDYDEAIRFDPKYVFAFNNRGAAWFGKKDYDRALRDYDEAIHLDPKCAPSLGNKGELLAICPTNSLRDGRKALELTKQACELSQYKEAWALAALAAAHAELGQFDDAIRWQKKALEDRDYLEDDRQKGKEKLRRYEDRKPWRDE